MRIRIERDWPWLLGLGGLVWWLLGRVGRVMRSIGRDAAEFWAKVPIPGHTLPDVTSPAVVDWGDSPVDDIHGWRKGWFDDYRVLTFAETGSSNPYVRGYLELRHGSMKIDGEALPGLWGYPIALLFLGEAMCRVSDPGSFNFSLIPEQAVTGPFAQMLVRPQVFRSLLEGHGFIFESPQQAGRVLRRLFDLCPVRWLTVNGWFFQSPSTSMVQQLAFPPFLSGTYVEIDCNQEYLSNLKGDGGPPPISE